MSLRYSVQKIMEYHNNPNAEHHNHCALYVFNVSVGI